MWIVLATILSSAAFEGVSLSVPDPVAPAMRVGRRPLRAQLDLVDLLGASWFVAPSRGHIEAALDNASGSLFRGERLDGYGLLLATPVVGPLMLAGQSSCAVGDRPLLVASGLLQLLGLSVAAVQLASGELGAVAEGPVLKLSPIAGGGLGLSVTITGF